MVGVVFWLVEGGRYTEESVSTVLFGRVMSIVVASRWGEVKLRCGVGRVV